MIDEDRQVKRATSHRLGFIAYRYHPTIGMGRSARLEAGVFMNRHVLFAMVLMLIGMGTTPALAQEAPGSTPAIEEMDPSGRQPTGEESGEQKMSGEYLRELRTVEESVHNLKERVFRSKATLQLLKELVIEGSTLGSRVAIWHVNKLGAAFSLESVQYFLDGKNIYSKVDPSGSLAGVKEIKIREQTVAPGTHTLQVNMVVRGNGFGLFSYLDGYQFKVQSSYSFEVEDGKLSTLRVLANTKGGVRRAFVDRLNVQYEERAEQLKGE